MASFDQSPLSQASLGLEVAGLSLGSDASAAGTSTSNVRFASDGSSGGPAYNPPSSAVRPGWRRESKEVVARA
jgi:hypothetical protein